MNNYKIYCHVFPNGKRYVGQTKQEVNKRFGSNGINYAKDCPYLWNAIQKYGWENVEHIVLLEGLTAEEANFWEQEYIKEYRSNERQFGYNLTSGGKGCKKFDYQAIYDYWCQNKNVALTAEYFHCNPATVRQALSHFQVDGKDRIRMSAGKYHAKEVHSYTLEGKYIESFDTISLGAKAANCPHNNILKVLNGERKSAGGRRWSLEKKDYLDNYFYKGKTDKIKPVKQYDLQGNYLATYPSLADAARAIGKEQGGSNISRCCHNLLNTAYGYKWSF